MSVGPSLNRGSSRNSSSTGAQPYIAKSSRSPVATRTSILSLSRNLDMDMNLDLFRIQTESRQRGAVVDETTRRTEGTSKKNEPYSHGILTHLPLILPPHTSFRVSTPRHATPCGSRQPWHGGRVPSRVRECLVCYGAPSVRFKRWI
jgi:hypothetical protein